MTQSHFIFESTALARLLPMCISYSLSVWKFICHELDLLFCIGSGTEASMDPPPPTSPNVAIMFTWSSCFMLTCRGITRHDDMKYVNMTT